MRVCALSTRFNSFVTDNLQSKSAKALDIRTPLCYNRQCKERYLTHSSIFSDGTAVEAAY